jgi:uncharacterized protein (UPF0261 family)
VLLPRKGISIISVAGHPFHDAAADEALFSAIRENLREGILVQELDCTINDPAFSEACAKALLAHLSSAAAQT